MAAAGMPIPPRPTHREPTVEVNWHGEAKIYWEKSI